MLIGKNGIRREIDSKRLAEFKEKGYTEIFAENPPVVEEGALVTAQEPPAKKIRKKG